MPDPVPPSQEVTPAVVPGDTGTPITPHVEPEGVTITLDGRQVTAKKGEMLIAAAERAGTYIPRFCYHPRMKPVGMCRMCLIDLKGPRGSSLQPACFIEVAPGMEAVTDSPKVKKAQDGILEFLLVNHPLDCPVCDKGGECPLQDQTMAYGPGETRFVEEKRHWDKPTPLSPLVLIDRERCIQCARCTRFADEVAGDAGIDFASRSDTTEVAIFPGEPFVSNFSGNVVQICPVGALLAKPYRFKARPWDLEQVETTCTLCAVGCRTAAQSSSDQIVRFLGVDSDPVNWGWLCDKGRFGFEALNSPERTAHPMARRVAATAAGANGSGGNGGTNKELVRVSWSEAFSEIASQLAGVGGDAIGVIGGARLPNEDAYAWSKLARTVLHTDNVDAQLGDGLPGDLVASLPRATIDQVCDASLIVTVAPDIKEELPVLYLRLRHAAVESGVPIIELSPVPTGLSSLASQCLRYMPGELAALARALCSDSPVTSDVAGVAAEEVERARTAIATAGPRVAVVLGRPSVAEPSTGVTDAALALAGLQGVSFLPVLRRSNVNGAIDLGLSPGLLPGRVGLEDGRAWYERLWGAALPKEKGLDTIGMLTRAAAGAMQVLFLVGADPLSDCPDKELAALALERTPFVVAVDALPTASTAHADVVLPAAIYTERRGTFTNIEGRISWLGKKVTAPGTARPDWMIAVELATHLGGDLGAGSLEDLWAEIERVSALHRGVSRALRESLSGRDGVVVPLGLDGGLAGRPEVPEPLDPMADPGIASADIHPVPPAAGIALVSTPDANAGPSTERAGTSQVTPPPRIQMKPPARAGKPASPAPSPASNAEVARAEGGGAEGGGAAANERTLRLVASRPMWDGGALVQRSPSLASLHPALELRANPEDLARFGMKPGTQVRVSSQRGSVVVTATPDPSIPTGIAVLPFNLPGGGAGELIDASAPHTDVRLGHAEGL
jgi:NADH-quinone oxidoreductase subunit G